MLQIDQAEYLEKYRLKLRFNNGREGVADLAETIAQDRRPIFSALGELSSFKQFSVEHSTVVWKNGLDLAAEYLFYLAFKEERDLQPQFRQWGYTD